MQARKWRAVALVMALMSGGLAVAGHSAAAQARGWLFGVGAGLSETVARVDDGAQELTLNGARFGIESSTVGRRLDRVLEDERVACGAPRGFENSWVVHEVRSLGGATPSPNPADGRVQIADGSDASDDSPLREGVVACFRTSEGVDALDVPALLRRFADRGDLSELGSFRYSYARETTDGRTVVLRVEPRGSLIPEAMFPASEDAPGQDLSHLPRPENARRVLSVNHNQEPDVGLAAYRVEGNPEAVLRRYLSRARASGISSQGQGDARLLHSATGTWVLTVAPGPSSDTTELLVAGLP